MLFSHEPQNGNVTRVKRISLQFLNQSLFESNVKTRVSDNVMFPMFPRVPKKVKKVARCRDGSRYVEG